MTAACVSGRGSSQIVFSTLPGTEMEQLGRMAIGLGLVLVVVGVAILLASRFGLKVGQLPLDFHWQWGSTSIYFPLGTTLLISAILSLVFMAFGRR